jgi:hypothetical protein
VLFRSGTDKTYIAVNIVLDGETTVKSVEIYFLKRTPLEGKISELLVFQSKALDIDGPTLKDGMLQCTFADGNGFLKGKLSGDLITCEVVLTAEKGFMKAGTYNLTAQSGPLSFYAVQVMATFPSLPPITPVHVPGIN